MGGGLGFILGAGLGMFRQQAQKKAAQQDATIDMLSHAAVQQPDLLKNPAVEKEITKARGKEYFQALSLTAQANQKMMASFPQEGGGQPSASAAPQAAPAGAQGQQAPQAPPKPPTPDEQIASKWDHIHQLEAWGRAHPEHEDLVNQHIASTHEEIDDIRKAQEFSISKSQQLQEFESTQQARQDYQQQMIQLREQGKEDSDAFKSATLGLRQSEIEGQKQFRDFMESEKTQQDKTQQQMHLQTAVSTLQSRAKAIAALPPNQAKSLLPGFNANVKMLKKQLKDAGLDDIAEGIEPLKVGAEPGKFWGTNPAIEADESGDATPPGRAVKDKSGKVIGYTTDGKTMTPASP